MRKKLLILFSLLLTTTFTACTNPWAETEPEPERKPNYTIGGWYDTSGNDSLGTNGNTSAENGATGNGTDSNLPGYESPYADEAPSSGMVRSDLTNEWIFATAGETRPLAVMVPNNVSSLPHYNLSKAGIIYECNVEYELTRLMPVFDDWTELQRIGNIRSARDYFVTMAMEWDALFLHIGNIWYADEILSRSEVNNINGNVIDTAIYRVSTERRDYDQSAYANGYAVKAAAEKLGYSLKHTDLYTPGHFSFAPKFRPTTLTDVYGSMNATYVSLDKAYPINQPYFVYNTEDNLYYRYEYGIPHVDGINNEQLSFANIIIQNTYREYRQDGAYLIYRMHDTKGDGYFITQGRAVHVFWKKEGTYGITKYYDENGDEIILNQGKTMICIVEKGDAVTIQ